MTNYAIILAAGQGKRMKDNLPKCLHLILKKPMVKYVYDAIDHDLFNKVILVSNEEAKDQFVTVLGDVITLAIQKEKLGTGDALRVGASKLEDLDGYTLVLPGDEPLIDYEDLKVFYDTITTSNADLGVLTTNMEDPTNYGRIIRKNDNVVAIREQFDLNYDEFDIKEVNTGIYLIKNTIINDLLAKMSNGKCYLNSIVEVALRTGLKVLSYTSSKPNCYLDINDYYTLSIVERQIKINTNKKHLLNGVNIISPETVTISSEVEIEAGVTIYPNTFITGKSYIHQGAEIGPDSELHNAIVDNNAVVRHSLVTDSHVGANTTVGPFAHLRMNTSVEANCRIGNYVEIKNSKIGEGTKISHLTYLGDTTCGKNVNWGCGCVTVNYDGKFKNKTYIGDNVFIGCNTNLIAPLSVGNNVFIAAGSTITDDIPDEAFSIARTRQITKEDYARKYSYTKK